MKNHAESNVHDFGLYSLECYRRRILLVSYGALPKSPFSFWFYCTKLKKKKSEREKETSLKAKQSDKTDSNISLLLSDRTRWSWRLQFLLSCPHAFVCSEACLFCFSILFCFVFAPTRTQGDIGNWHSSELHPYLAEDVS